MVDVLDMVGYIVTAFAPISFKPKKSRLISLKYANGVQEKSDKDYNALLAI